MLLSGVNGDDGDMVSQNDILAARDASLACLDLLTKTHDELETLWRVEWEGDGHSRTSGPSEEPRNPNVIEKSMDEGLRRLTSRGHTNIPSSADERDDDVVLRSSCCRGAAMAIEAEKFLERATALVEDMRRHAAVAMDEALTDDVCAFVERAREDGVVLAGRSYSCCHVAAVDHVARFALCWPSIYPFPEVMLRLKEAASEPAVQLREIAEGIRAEANAAIRALPDH